MPNKIFIKTKSKAVFKKSMETYIYQRLSLSMPHNMIATHYTHAGAGFCAPSVGLPQMLSVRSQEIAPAIGHTADNRNRYLQKILLPATTSLLGGDDEPRLKQMLRYDLCRNTVTIRAPMIIAVKREIRLAQ